MMMRNTPNKKRLRIGAAINILLVIASSTQRCSSFAPSTPPSTKHQADDEAKSSSRRDLIWKLPVGVLGSYVYGRIGYNALSVQGIKYPKEHEQRVRSTIKTTLLASIRPNLTKLRVLEVGVGKDFRLLRRGLYDDALEELRNAGVQQVEVVGVDPLAPNDAAKKAARLHNFPLHVDITYLQDSIESELPYRDGYFDAIVCCLTLCSVDNVTMALKEMDRLLRPNGGCLGYVEHVAVNPDEPFRFLEFQQELLDPVQQLLADNCHLHRYTQSSIMDEFLAANDAVVIAAERYTVNAMWPVSCQTCGVVQRQASAIAGG